MSSDDGRAESLEQEDMSQGSEDDANLDQGELDDETADLFGENEDADQEGQRYVRSLIIVPYGKFR